MIGLDTNILMRYLTGDDETQYRAILKLLCRKGAYFFVPDLVLVELDWVLRSAYDWSRDEIADAIARLLQVQNLQFEDEDRIRRALGAIRRGADLSDELLVAKCREHDCEQFVTFDVTVIKRHSKFATAPKE